MKKIARSPILFFTALGAVCNAQPHQPSAGDGFRFIASAQHQYDSNFSRIAEEALEEQSSQDEQITRAALGVGYNKSISAQRLGLRFTANQYRYAERDHLNENSWEGSASWRSRFGHNASSLLNYERTESPVDQLEFRGRDLVARENANAQLSLGDSRRLGIIIGAHQFQQSHSNIEREFLDFEDEDFFAEVRYKGPASSWVSVRYREGDRDYEWVELLPRDLNFEYQQWEIETSWALTPKTELTGVAGYFEREGATNNDEGALAGLKLSWQTTAKVATEIAYTFNQPAQGETTDAPIEVSSSSFTVSWQWTTKLQLAAGGIYSEFDYINIDDASPYVERNISISPLAIEWRFSDTLQFRLHSQWVERHSPILIRDYDGHIITGGLGLVF